MSEPDAGSYWRGMKCAARPDGGDWVLNGSKHFISHADIADFVIVFVASGEEATAAGPKKKITCFLVDRGAPGFEIRRGYNSVSHHGYHNRSEEHTSGTPVTNAHLVCRLLLEKKKTTIKHNNNK